MRVYSLLFILLYTGCASSPRPSHRLPAAPLERVHRVRDLVEQSAERHHVPVELILGVIQVESSFNPHARSSAGARGLMQLMPQTARSLARRLGRDDYDIEDPAFNIDAGTAYLALLLKTFDGDFRLSLAGYNSGPYRVLRWVKEGTPLPAYSERYISAVLACRDAFAQQRPIPSLSPSIPSSSAEARNASRADTELDRDGLRALVKKQQQHYGDRPDEPLPTSLPAMDSTSAPMRRRAGRPSSANTPTSR